MIGYLVPIFGDLAYKEQNITEDKEDFFEDEGTKIGMSNVLILVVSKNWQ